VIQPGGQNRRERVCSRGRRGNQLGPTCLGPILSVQTLLPQSMGRDRCQKLYSSVDDSLARMITLTRQDKTGEKARSEGNGATHRMQKLLRIRGFRAQTVTSLAGLRVTHDQQACEQKRHHPDPAGRRHDVRGGERPPAHARSPCSTSPAASLAAYDWTMTIRLLLYCAAWYKSKNWLVWKRVDGTPLSSKHVTV